MKSVKQQLAEDLFIYGSSFSFDVERKFWNPLRYIFGKMKRVRVDPKNVFLEFRKPKGAK